MGSHYTISKGSVFCISGPEDDFTISRNMLPVQYASTINIGVLDGQFLILLSLNDVAEESCVCQVCCCVVG